MLYRKEIFGSAIFGIWQVEETCENLLSALKHEEWLDVIFCTNSKSRQREMLATRVLIKELLGEEKQICYLSSGRPYLYDASFQISISHTRGYVAVVLDEMHTVGLDIEQRTDKIFRVRERITTKYDFIDPNNEQVHLLLHWSAKEAMFKYIDSAGVDFRRDLHIESFTPQASGIFGVSESKTEERRKFDAYYLVTDDFVLVFLVERVA